MDDTQLIDEAEKLSICVVRRPGSGGGWEWVAYNGKATGVSLNRREAIKSCIESSKPL